jgi:hypothetical protein
MINKLRKNFAASNLLATIAFVVTSAFASWYSFSAASVMVLGSADIYVTLFASLLGGILGAFILPLLVNFVLNLARIYSVPRAEFSLLAKLFFAASFLVSGALGMLRFLSPFLATWGLMLIDAAVTTAACFTFYHVTAKLYFNSHTRVYYFRLIIIVYAALMLLGGYVL